MGSALQQISESDSGALRDAAWQWLLEHSRHSAPKHWSRGVLYSRLLASLMAQQGVMAPFLGLSSKAFAQMLARHFPKIDAGQFDGYGIEPDRERWDEYDELYTLFMEHTDGADEGAEWAAGVLATGCMGGDHLWQDMGFWSRTDLSAFIGEHFPLLAAKNIHDMKWKRFFYKQLCAREGVYTCRAPSCQVCADYSNCFGPE